MDEPIRILMAEDMVFDADLAQREIRKVLHSCAFMRVETREDFIEAVHSFQPDLIITDYRMPRFDGMTALRLSIELAPFTPVIVLTGAINEDTAVECMKAGATDYVIKEHIKRLGQAVNHALDEKQIRAQRRKAEESLREREVLYRTLVETLPDAVIVTNTHGEITYVSPMTLTFFGYDHEDEVLGVDTEYWLTPGSLEMGKDAFRCVIAGGTIRNLELQMYRKDRSTFYGEISESPLEDGHSNITGIIITIRDVSERKQANMALQESEALYRARTIELETLFTLSTLLRQAKNARDMLQVALNEVQRLLGVDSATFMLLDREKENFNIALAVGTLSPGIGRSFSVKEESLCRQVLMTKRPYVTADYALDAHRFAAGWNDYTITDLGAAAYVPIQSEDEILGVLMMAYNKRPNSRLFGHDEVRLLSTIGEMTGNYLRRAWLFEDLQISHEQISNAYEDTIDALSRALDLRDRDTEGHTRRVIALTLSLARRAGMDDAQLVHVRRGAYLHDMGKIGIPDMILLKPGALTEEEWAIMRRHPQYTYDMLSHIDFLRPALDIPYCHHEKWDGTGYPCGKKGEEIPLAARLFAVVDVWDALTNERPYRPAWPREKVVRYIQEQSGKHFDPHIVDIFLEIIQDE